MWKRKYKTFLAASNYMPKKRNAVIDIIRNVQVKRKPTVLMHRECMKNHVSPVHLQKRRMYNDSCELNKIN